MLRTEFKRHSLVGTSVSQPTIFDQTGRPSAGGSHMSGVWGREKPRQAFPPQICGEAASNPRLGDSVRIFDQTVYDF